MSRKLLLMLSISVTLAPMTLSPNAAFAQFPPLPPMAGPPPTAAGPPPLAAGGPPALVTRPPTGFGGAPRAGLGGPAPRLGTGPAPRGDLAAVGQPGAFGRGGPAAATAARATSVTHNRLGVYGRYGGSYRAAHAAGAYAVGATAGYAYGSPGYGYSSDRNCYYVYRRYRHVLVCS